MYDKILVSGGTGPAGKALNLISDTYSPREFFFAGKH